MRHPFAAALALFFVLSSSPLWAQSQSAPAGAGLAQEGSAEFATFNVRPADGNAIAGLEAEDYVPGRVVVRFREDVAVDAARGVTSVPAVDAIAGGAGLREMRPLLAPSGSDHARRAATGLSQIYVYDFSSAADVEALVAAFEARPEVLYAEPDRYYVLHADPPTGVVPDDPLYPLQWGLNNTGQAIPNGGGGPVGTPGSDINAELAWAVETGSSSVSIAILDTGVDIDHPEFDGRVLPGWDFIDNNDNPRPAGNAHGTAAAGIALAAGNNAAGVAGVAWGAQLIPIRVCATNTCSTTAIASGISWAADQGASIISMSLGGTTLQQVIADAVTYAYTAGVVVLASAGNANSSSPRYPASLPEVISVGALSPCNTRKTTTSCDGETWWGSSFGSGMSFLAPGTRIHTTDILGSGGYTDGDYTATFNGTSAACPFAAGVAALVLSANPFLTPAEVRSVMESTAVDMGAPGYNDETGFGRLDAYAALRWSGLISIADARAAGAGADVMVQGTVTRAEGSLAFFQDHTGGLAIQASLGSSFFDAIADGTITNGTLIRLEGTLSMADGLLHFSSEDIEAYEVVAQGDGPAPQEVTLDELAGGYEAQVVRVRSALFVGASGTFESGASYQVTDASVSPATITLHVPDDPSNAIAGEPIPPTVFTFTGVVADGGLVAILSTDVQVVELAFTPSIEEGLQLAVEVGSTTDGVFTLTNTGFDELFFRFPQFAGDSRRLAYPANPLAHTAPVDYPEATKGAEAAHPIHSPTRGEGGPDEFGYTWIDSDEPGGPIFESIDIAGSGTVETLVQSSGCTWSAEDEGFAVVDLPFSFSYYGEQHTQVWASANGFIAFQQISGCTYSVGQIPSTSSPNSSSAGAMIAPMWADLHAYSTGQILTEQLPDGRLVIQWNDFRRFGQEGSSNVTMQAILSPGGAVKFQYMTIQGSFTSSTRVGQQDHDGLDGLLIASGAGYAAPGKAVLISSVPPFVTGVFPVEGSILPGASVDATVQVDAGELPEGTFDGLIMIETSETPLVNRDGPTFTTAHQYPVSLEVAEGSSPQAAIDPTEIGFSLPPGVVASQAAVLSNVAPVGPALEFTVSVTELPQERVAAGRDFGWSASGRQDAPEVIVVDPAAGSVAAGTSQELEITANTTDLADGLYEFLIAIGTNDPENETLHVEVTVLVADGELEFTPPIETGLEVTAEAGGSEDGTITLINNSSAEVAFSFTQFADAARARAPHRALRLPRAAADPRPGIGPRDQGGPDGFGYSWIDSAESGGPDYEWVDISAVGTELTAITGTWDGNAAVSLPFGFDFYGETYSEVTVSVNGWINFDLYSGEAWSNQPIPTAEDPSNFVAPFWDDLDMRDQGQVHTYFDPDAGRFIIQWTQVPRSFDEGSALTFQAQLFASGTIVYQYQQMSGTLSEATVGIEAPGGTDGLQVVFNAPYVQDELAVLIRAAPPFVSGVSPAAGTVAPGATAEVVVSFDAAGLFAGTYDGALAIETDEPDGGAYSYPVALVVLGEAGCTISPDPIAFGDVIVGSEATIEVSVANDGTAVCSLTGTSTTHEDFSAGFEGEANIAPGQSVAFDVSFAPSAPGAATGSLVALIDGDEVSVSLSGTGLAPPQASVEPAEVAIVVGPDETATAMVTLANLAAEGAADLAFSATFDHSQQVMIDFEDGVRPPEFTMGNPANFVAPSGGNPGRWLRNNQLATFAPNLYIGPAEDSPFLGDFVERNVQSISADAQTLVAPFGVVDRPFSLVLITHNGEPGNIEAHHRVYYPGPLAPQVGAGWSEYSFEIPSQYAGAMPEGWSGGYYGDPENLPPGVTWQDVVSEVDEVWLMWGHPAYFYLLQDFDLGVDNVGIIYGDAEEAPLHADPGEGIVAAGESEELTIHVDAAGFEEGIYEYELLVETTDPENPLIIVPVTVEVTTVGSEQDAAPLVFALEQNYPNPFSGQTTIEFSLPEASAVTVDVFDLTGRRLVTLVDAQLEAGYHSAVWQANGVASGVYLYRIQAGSYTKTLRALVVK